MRASKHPLPNIKGSLARKSEYSGFTLIEVLVATAVFILLMGLLLSLTSEASRLWQRAESQKARRQIARIVLETIGRDMESAAFTTNTNSLQFLLNDSVRIGSTNLNPTAAFWQAPTLGSMPGTLSEVGYFVQWIGTKSALCRYYVPSTATNSLFSSNSTIWDKWLWPDKITSYAPGLQNTDTYGGLLSENVVGLWITLYDSNNAAMTNYDSRTTTRRPTSAEISIAVIDPRTARRLVQASQITDSYSRSTNADSFVADLIPNLREGVQIFKTRVQLQAASRSLP